MADKKISELVSITGSATAADDYFVVVDTSGAVTYKISREELNNAIEQDVLENISITNLTSDLSTNGNDINFGDNDKAIFGAGSDLQIYHGGSASDIKETGTGNLRVWGDDIQFFNSAGSKYHTQMITDGAVTLYYNGAEKLSTTASGCDITGTATVDQLNIDSVGTFGNFDSKATISTEASFAGSDKAFRIKTTGGNVNHFVIEATTGNVCIGGQETTTFNGVGGDMKFVVIGEDGQTNISNNSQAAIAIVNTNQTAGNLAGLHFARADTDNSPNYAGASIVAQFPDAQVTGQYPKGDLAFLTSTTTNSAPSEKMRINSSGHITQTGYTAYGTSSIGYIGDAANLFAGSASDFAIRGTANVTFGIGASEKMRLVSSGSLNIGGTSGAAKLEINNEVSSFGNLTDSTINLATTGVTGRKANIGFGLAGGVANTNAATIGFDVTNGAGALQGDLFFATRGSTADSVPSERLRIDSSGNLQLGYGGQTTTAFAAPQGITIASLDNVAIQYFLRKGNQVEAHIGFKSSTDSNFYVGTGGGAGAGGIGVYGVYQANNSTSWSAVSDETQKTIVGNIENASEKVSTLRTVMGYYNTDETETNKPFLIAQDVQAVLPEAVSVADVETGVLGLSYTDVIPLLTAAIKEQRTTIQELETRIAALETE